MFVEHATFAGNTYGTSVNALAAVTSTGKIPVLELDLQGAIQLHAKKDRMAPVFTFIKPPSFPELKRRLEGRGTESAASVAKRLKRAKTELDYMESPEADYFQIVFVNDDLQKSFGYFRDEMKKNYPQLKAKGE
jgi:guanylate kinase